MSTPRPQRVFLSRTTNGLADTALKCEAILRDRGCEVIHQPDFTGSWRDVKGMLIDKLIDCDAAICLIGPACGMVMHEPVTGLKDPRTEGRHFSYTQLELLVARDLPRPVFTYLCTGGELIAPLKPESTDQQKSQHDFIEEFAKDGSNVRVSCDTFAKLEDDLRRISIPRTVSAGIRCNLPFSRLGELFVGREAFLNDLRQRLTSGSGAIIKSHAIHGIGGSGKTRTAIEYAWRYAREHTALLFVNADSPDALKRDLAALCGPLVLNLPAQTETDLEKQVQAALQWLENHDDWLLIIDNADTPEAIDSAQSLFARFRRGKILITTRTDRVFGDLTPLNLDLLSHDASVELLTVWTRPDSRASDTEKAAVRTLAGILGGLALALRQAAAYISEFDIKFTEYLRRYKENTAAALLWHDKRELEYPRELFITYQTSIAQLSDAARGLQKCLAWFSHEPIPNTLIEHKAAPQNAWRSLTELKNLHLAERHQNGETFSVHRVIQEITRQQQASPMDCGNPLRISDGAAGPGSEVLSAPVEGSVLTSQPPTDATVPTIQGAAAVETAPALSSTPLALCAALSWLNELFLGDPEDVRTWSVIEPLVPHGRAVALSAADAAIPEPSGRLMNQVASYYSAKAQHKSAEPLMWKVLEMSEKMRGPMDPVVATCLNNLATLHFATNRLAEAESLIRRALAIDEENYGPSHPDVARDINSLATLLQNTNRLAEAEPLKRRALAIDEKNYGISHPKVAIRLNNLASLLQDTNRLAEAEPLMRRALAIDEKCFGPSHPKVAIRLNNLATLLLETNHMVEAESLMRRALAIDEKSYGPSHPMVANRISNLAAVFLDTNRLADAEPLMRRALAIDEETYGLLHPNVARDLNNLASLFKATNRLAEAEPLLRRALAIDEESYGPSHPDVAICLNNLAQLLQTTGRQAEAEPLMRRALAINEESYGLSHPSVSVSLNNLAQLLQETNRLAEAEPLYRRALAIDEKSYGVTHPNVARDLNNLAMLLFAMNRFVEAKTRIRRAVEILLNSTAKTGQLHPELDQACQNFARILIRMGETQDGARKAIQKIVDSILKK